VISLIFFLFVGVLLFSCLFFLARRNPRPEGSSTALVGARKALTALQTGLLPTELVNRLFAKEDWDYVRAESPRPVQELFMDERKEVALLWLGQVCEQIGSLRRFHRGAARHCAKLDPRVEVQLALSFAGLTTACRALQVLVYVGGPYMAPRMVWTVANAAARACQISEESISFLNASRMGVLASQHSDAGAA
jgi:hypothetical protein